MQELWVLCAPHNRKTTPYHPASDGLVEWFNRTLLLMLAMFTGENRDDLDYLLHKRAPKSSDISKEYPDYLNGNLHMKESRCKN